MRLGKGSGRLAKLLSPGFAAACLLALGAVSARASSFTFTAAEGNLAAAAEFEVVGNDLVVTLTNTSAADVLIPADVLTAVFFDIQADAPLSLTPETAVLGPGSVVLFGPAPAGGVVGGEWAFETGILGAPDDQSYGIGSAGFGIFGSLNRFEGPNLQGPIAVNGLQYGIVSAGDDPATGNAPVTGGQHLIKNEVVFTISGVPADFDPELQISNITFQYGTSLSEPTIRPPEPATLALMAMGAVAMLRHRRS